MTDRERLLEQVREAVSDAEEHGRLAGAWMGSYDAENAARYASLSAHHALTALALREAVGVMDTIRPWQAPMNWDRLKI